MTSSMFLLLSVLVASGFGPNVRIDHQNLPTHSVLNCAIAVGPGAPSSQPLYVVFEDDALLPGGRSDLWLQRSSDGGRTWLPADLLIRRGEPYVGEPDIATDSAGNVYVAYLSTDSVSHDQVLCMRSSDGGATWTAPVTVADSADGRIGSLQIAADPAGNLLVAWNQLPGGISHVFSSASIDRGATWSPRVQVDDDTTNQGCYGADVFIQPGTNHYLVVAEVPRWFEGIPHIRPCAFVYRSTDRGLTFQPGVQLDTFDYYASSPHVVADRNHIICDYFGQGQNVRHSPRFVEARTFYTQPDTWGGPSSITNLDSLHHLYFSGPLALSADRRLHTALTISDSVLYGLYYSSSSDHGVSWSDLERIDDDTTWSCFYPDIGVDSTGYAYVVWVEARNGLTTRIWFSTNNPAAIAEEPPQVSRGAKAHAITGHDGIEVEYQLPAATRVRATLHDVVGRQVGMQDAGVQQPGLHKLSWVRDNEGRKLSAGTYFVLIDAGTARTTVKAVVQ
jgi:hypothetical protein